MSSEYILCTPDRYLTESHLQALFNDFKASVSTFQPAASIFSSLVNNVRQVYLAALVAANEDQLSQFREHTQQLAEVKRECEKEHGPPPKYGAGKPGKSASPSPCVDVPVGSGGATTKPADSGAGDTKDTQVAQAWPANTFTLHVGSYSEDHRRDMPSWVQMNRDGWTERLDFRVFKYEEPGTIRLTVREQHHPTHRVMVDRDPCSLGDWTKRLEFYAYEKPRPRTRMIWVGYRDGPPRCIFVMGDKEDKMENWERKLEFWVPV